MFIQLPVSKKTTNQILNAEIKLLNKITSFRHYHQTKNIDSVNLYGLLYDLCPTMFIVM